MAWFFSIERFPEVQMLPPGVREALLRESKAPGVIRLLFAAGWRGLLTSLGVTGMLHAALVSNQLPRLDLIITPILFVLLLFGTTGAFHYWIMMRYRGRLRTAIRDASRGGRAPICLSCGHDLTGIEGDRCPECGAKARVSDVQ